MLYQLLTPEVGSQGMAERIAAQRIAQAAAQNRRNSAQSQSGDIPAIPDPINTNQSNMFSRAWGALPDLPASNASSGSMDEYAAPQQRPGSSTARAVTALDEPWSPTQSQNAMDQGITAALSAQSQGGQKSAPPPLDMSFINANFRQPQDGLSPGDAVAQNSGMPRPKPRPGDLGMQVAGTGGGMPGIIKASYDLPATDGAAGNQAAAAAGGEEAQQATPQQYGPPMPTTRDLLYNMAMSGRQDGQQTQTGNMENIALALMMGGLNMMANASKPNANAIGSFGEGNIEGLKTLMTLNQFDQRNQRYKNRDELGALSALANIENAQATRENTAAYQNAMLRERGEDRDLRRQMYEGTQANQAAQLASMDAYRQAMLGQRAQEMAATQDYHNKSLDLQRGKSNDGVSPEMKRQQWIQDRAMKEAEMASQEFNPLSGETVVNPEKMQQNYSRLLAAYTQQYGGGQGDGGQQGGSGLQLPAGAPEGAQWQINKSTGQPVVVVMKDGKPYEWRPGAGN